MSLPPPETGDGYAPKRTVKLAVNPTSVEEYAAWVEFRGKAIRKWATQNNRYLRKSAVPVTLEIITRLESDLRNLRELLAPKTENDGNYVDIVLSHLDSDDTPKETKKWSRFI